MFVPSPTCPLVLLPQHLPIPAAVVAHVIVFEPASRARERTKMVSVPASSSLDWASSPEAAPSLAASVSAPPGSPPAPSRTSSEASSLQTLSTHLSVTSLRTHSRVLMHEVAALQRSAWQTD